MKVTGLVVDGKELTVATVLAAVKSLDELAAKESVLVDHVNQTLTVLNQNVLTLDKKLSVDGELVVLKL